jgi:hypothetical protein
MSSPLMTLTIDDFDPLIRYSNYGDWNTPDPSLNPKFWNESVEVTGVEWYEGELEFDQDGAGRVRLVGIWGV